MPKPEKIHYFGKVFTRNDGDMQRRVVSLDKSHKRDDGEWENIKPDFIQYRDGSQIHFEDGPITLKYLDEPKGNHVGNIYQAVWRKKDDSDIPF